MRTLEQRIAALERATAATAPPLITTNYAATEWQTLLVAAPSTGEIRITLPTASPQNRCAVVYLAFVTTGSARIVASGGTVNGLAAGITNTTVGAFSAVSDGSSGWLVLPGIAAGSIPGAKLGAFTGEVTKPSGSAVLTVARSTDFATSPWTGNHKFEQQLLLGAEQTEIGTGAINVTLGDVIRLRFSANGNHTLGTISGCSEGRLLIVEWTGTGTHTTTHDSATANAVSCPGDTNLAITGRGGFLAVGRTASTSNWKVIATTN